MAKIFYTEYDIEDMVKRGERSIVMGEDVVLTDLAYEKAKRLDMRLVDPNEKPPAAPVRPYLSTSKTQATTRAAGPSAQPASQLEAMKTSVKQAVKAKLGSQVDDALLDRIIDRVARQLGVG